MTTRILLTGAAGFIGHHLARHILESTDWEVLCLDRLDTAGHQARLAAVAADHGCRVHVCWHDLRAELTASRLWPWIGQIDCVVHLAASSHVLRAVADPTDCVHDNVLGTFHALEFARRQWPRPARVLYFSTDEVMGPADNGACFGAYARHWPTNPYAASKAAGEQLCTAYAITYDLPLIVTHCTNVYGPGQHAEKFIPLASHRIASRQPLPIHCRGGVSSSRYYVHVDDVCRAVLCVLRYGEPLVSRESGGYNISGDVEHSNLDVAQAIGAIIGQTPILELTEHPAGRPRHDQRYCLDGSGLRALGWAPSVLFSDGLVGAVRAALAQ